MTLAEIREVCKGQFALAPTDDDPFLTDDLWTAAINRAYRWAAFRVPLITGILDITTVTGTREYALSDDETEIAVVDFVQFMQQGLNWFRLGQVQFTRISSSSLFQLQQGSPSCYYTRGQNIGFFPIPDTENDGALCQVWGSLYPALLEDDADEPEIGTYQQDWLIAPAVFEMAKQVFNRSAGKMSPAQLQLYQKGRDDALTELRMTIEGRTSEAQFINTSYGTDSQGYAGFGVGVW